MPAIVEGASDADIARWLADSLRAPLGHGQAQVAVAMPGGKSPFPIIARLIGYTLPWRRVCVWPTDDRAVPLDHPASNSGALRRAFAGTDAQVTTLDETKAPPRFALAWIGMGADGHIASLFPSCDPRHDDPRKLVRLTPDPLPPEAPFARISLTFPALLDSDEIMLMARGKDKRAVLDAAVGGGSDTPVARLLRGARQPVTVFV